MITQSQLSLHTQARSFSNITDPINKIIAKNNIEQGLCNVFLKHTSASLILCENADPDVRYDLEHFMQKLVIDGDPDYRHDAEGLDDMPAHIRSVLTQNSISIPIQGGQLALGTWQGLYLWEHRTSAFKRNVLVSIT
ncbi:MAG: secondary thiamine-phosphate synthase enzyme YjbQ [Gammaproteobacteria bacterium]|nr:secondary thiamine-phosphate synthase enzyme YjbQ [Gammaproteobacteria bacterium]MCH9743805.1 secondary thiamine-phosphate synthase enzyme YjbQ [Gammaproteobacteria bacterium]